MSANRLPCRLLLDSWIHAFLASHSRIPAPSSTTHTFSLRPVSRISTCRMIHCVHCTLPMLSTFLGCLRVPLAKNKPGPRRQGTRRRAVLCSDCQSLRPIAPTPPLTKKKRLKPLQASFSGYPTCPFSIDASYCMPQRRFRRVGSCPRCVFPDTLATRRTLSPILGQYILYCHNTPRGPSPNLLLCQNRVTFKVPNQSVRSPASHSVAWQRFLGV